MIDLSLIPDIFHIIWDIDGVITDKSAKLDLSCISGIAGLAKRKVRQSFVSGRPLKKTRDPIMQILGKERDALDILPMLRFYGEGGFDGGRPGFQTLYPLPQEYPFSDPEIRDQVANLFWQEKDLKRLEGPVIPNDPRVPKDHYLAENFGGGWIIPPINMVRFYHLFFDESKKRAFSADIIRDIPDRKLYQEYIDHERENVQEVSLAVREIVYARFGTGETFVAAPNPFSINFLPVVNGKVVDKNLGAARAIDDLAKEMNVSNDFVAKHTIAFGDAASDFFLGLPSFPDNSWSGIVPFAFVGNQKNFAPQKESLIFAHGNGASYDGSDVVGPSATNWILDELLRAQKFI